MLPTIKPCLHSMCCLERRDQAAHWGAGHKSAGSSSEHTASRRLQTWRFWEALLLCHGSGCQAAAQQSSATGGSSVRNALRSGRTRGGGRFKADSWEQGGGLVGVPAAESISSTAGAPAPGPAAAAGVPAGEQRSLLPAAAGGPGSWLVQAGRGGAAHHTMPTTKSPL